MCNLFVQSVFLFGSRQRGQNMAVFSYQALVIIGPFRLEILSFGTRTLTDGLHSEISCHFTQVVGRSFNNLLLQNNWRFSRFSLLNFFSFISSIISSGRFERVNLKRESSFKDLMNSSFIAFKCDQRTTNKMNARKTWGKQITTNFMVKTRRYSTFEFVYAKFPDDPMMTIGYGANIMPCFVGYQKRKNLS